MKYPIQPESTVSARFVEIREGIIKTLCERIYRDLKVTSFSNSTFLNYLEVEINNIQDELNYLITSLNQHEMTSQEIKLIEETARKASIASLICLELYSELTK